MTVGGLPLTANIVTMSVFGAIVMHIVSMLSLIRLRACEPDLQRPLRAALYPLFPGVALITAVISLAAMIYYNAVIYAKAREKASLETFAATGRTSDGRRD